MTIVEKAAYLKGLTEGFGIEPDSREGKLWGALTDLVSAMAHEVQELQEKFEEHDEVLDDVYEQLIYLQEITQPDEELTDYDEDDYEYDFAHDDDEDEDELYKPSLRLYDPEEEEPGEEDEEEPEESEDEELDYDGVLYDVTCPGCGETITFDEETLDQGSIRCPKCGETLEFDLGGDEE